MNAKFLSAPHAAPFNVPVTVRTLAMRGLAAAELTRAGAVQCDGRRLRERAVNWLALAMLLAAWNVEAHLDAGDGALRGGALSDDSPQTAGRQPDSFDWTEPGMTKWTSCAAHNLR